MMLRAGLHDCPRTGRAGGAWVETTQREIDWHKRTIGMYDGLIRKLRVEHGG
jgi:hypothetical protein